MSVFTVTHLPEDNVIVVKVSSQYVPRLHMNGIVEQMELILEASPDRLVLIFDFTLLKLGLDDYLHATDDSIRGAGKRILSNPKVKAAIIASPNKMWHMTARGLRSDAFGRLNVFAYNSVDDALTYLRERRRSQIGEVAAD